MEKTFEEMLPIARMVFCLIQECKLIGPNGKAFYTEWEEEYGLHDCVEYRTPEHSVYGHWLEWCHTQYGAFDVEISWDLDEVHKIDFKEPGWRLSPKTLKKLKKYAGVSMRIYRTIQDVAGIDLGIN